MQSLVCPGVRCKREEGVGALRLFAFVYFAVQATSAIEWRVGNEAPETGSGLHKTR